ncbi:MAG TPA: TIGR00725 family protein [Solirubrobacteraceae bacterium]|nr:TIGR00725 family protein [Solirubrobacteraceae bacterium]
MYVAVVGAGEATEEELAVAEEVGARLAATGAVLVTGGLGGVMEAASRGAAQAGGSAVGLLPGLDRSQANPWATIALPTGLGELRNGLVVRAADAVIAIGGAYGTLSEIALALKAGKPVVGVGSWAIDGVGSAGDAEEAVAAALAARGGSGPRDSSAA